MKRCFILFFAVAMMLQVRAQKLTVIVTNVENDKGKVGVAVYGSKDEFLKTPVATQGIKAKKGEVTLVVEKLPAGEYAISVLHDENDNQKMDTNVVGIPKEGFGFSNDVMGAFGPPGWDKAKIKTAGKDQTITIKLKHF